MRFAMPEYLKSSVVWCKETAEAGKSWRWCMYRSEPSSLPERQAFGGRVRVAWLRNRHPLGAFLEPVLDED